MIDLGLNQDVSSVSVGAVAHSSGIISKYDSDF